MNNNQTLTMYTKSLITGIYSFSVSLTLFDTPIRSINQNVNLRTYKLVPILNNITAVQLEQPIILDASQSYDEGDIGSFTSSTQPFMFQWTCPGNLEIICSLMHSSMFMLTYNQYKPYVLIYGLSFDITLTLTREMKSSSLIYPITLSEIINSVDNNFWHISQKTKRTFKEDIIFNVEFLNTTNNYKIEDFEYHWTISNFAVNNYLNTQKESSLRVRFDDINNLIDFVTLKLTEISSQNIYTKNFQYKSVNLPFGKCLVTPQSGSSGVTPFRITASNWMSEYQPLKFAFYYENNFGIKFLISQFYDFFTSVLPYGTKFFIEATNMQGYVGTVNCEIQIKQNSLLNNLDSQFTSQLDIFTKNEIYYSNMNTQYSIGYENFYFDQSMNFINNFFDTIEDTIIDQNMEKIISLMSILNSCESDLKMNNNVQLFNDLMEKVSFKLNAISTKIDHINSFAILIDDNINRFYSESANEQNLKFLKQYDDMWANIINSVYNSLISGQNEALKTGSNRVTISRISKINSYSIQLMTTNNKGLYIVRTPNNYLMKPNNSTTPSNDCGYALEYDVCIERSEIMNHINFHNLTEIGIFLKVQDLPFIPNQNKASYLFSLNSVKVSLSTDETSANSRILSESNTSTTINNSFKYHSYLNLPDLDSKQFSHVIQATTCVVYDLNYNINATVCNSWYDNVAKVSLCECSISGSVANLYDQHLSELNRRSQFPSLQYSIFNNYSMGVVFALFALVGLLYIIASHFDRIEGDTKQHKIKKYYDVGQNLIVDFTKFGFGKGIEFPNFFLYMVKMTHPLLSIFYIYSFNYSRGLRVLDLYLQIKLTFLFSMLPYYMTNNSDFTAIKNARNVSDKDKSPGDLAVAITKILTSVFYSFIGIVMSNVIIGFLNAIYYENILHNESKAKYKYMLKTLKKIYRDDIYVYVPRFANAKMKLKFLINMREVVRNIAQKNQLKSNLNKNKKKFNDKNGNNFEKNFSARTHLDQLYKNSIAKSTNVNEIMLPKPIYDICSEDIPLNLFEFNNYDNNTLTIIRTNDVFISKENYNSKKLKNNFVSSISEYSYKIRSKNKTVTVLLISLQIVDDELLNEEHKIKKFRTDLKSILFVIIFISSYIFLIVMITDIYNKYQDNIFKICISPLISVVLIRYVITQNILTFIHSLFMYKFGEKIYSDNRKSLNPIKLVFRFIIPQFSKINHKALLAYLRFTRIWNNSKIEEKNNLK